jgi:hypothetical protein
MRISATWLGISKAVRGATIRGTLPSDHALDENYRTSAVPGSSRILLAGFCLTFSVPVPANRPTTYAGIRPAQASLCVKSGDNAKRAQIAYWAANATRTTSDRFRAFIFSMILAR